MFSFNGRCTRPCSRNIPNGFNLMASVPCARHTNRASQNCLVFLHRASTAPLPNQRHNSSGTTGHANPKGEEITAKENKVGKLLDLRLPAKPEDGPHLFEQRLNIGDLNAVMELY